MRWWGRYESGRRDTVVPSLAARHFGVGYHRNLRGGLPGLSDDRLVPGLRALADGVHAVGGRVCVQLCHQGKTAGLDTADGRPLLVPSIPTQKPI